VADLFPQNRAEFEAEADRARESARTLLAASLVAEAAHDRRSDATHEGRAQQRGVAGLVHRIRSRLDRIRVR
jgi:hypothetical protein